MKVAGCCSGANMWVKVVMWLGCMAVLTMLVFGVWSLFPDKTSVDSLKVLQLMQSLCVFLLPPLLMACLWSKQPMGWLHLDHGMPWKVALLAVALIVVGSPCVNLLSYCNQQMALPSFLAPLEAWMQQQEEAAAQLTERFLKADSAWGLLGNVCLMALIPAIGEELTFRGVVQGLLTRGENKASAHVAIWASAVIFSAVHCQFYGFVPRMLLGALFGYALYWSGSLWVPILMHFTNNALAVVMYYVSEKAQWESSVAETFGTGDTLWGGIVSMVLVAAGVYLLRRSRTMSNASSRMSSGN